MNKYLNIDVNSTAYSKLSKEEKLRVVKEKLKFLFNDRSRKTVTERYNGTWRTVPADMVGIYHDLCEREKSLEKRVSIDFDYDAKNESEKNVLEKEEAVLVKEKRVFVEPFLNTKSVDDLSIDDRIKLTKAKLFAIFDSTKDYEKKEVIHRVSYKDEKKFVAHSLVSDYKKLKKELEDLEYLKRISEKNKDLNLVNNNMIISDDNDEEDYLAVWEPVFNAKKVMNDETIERKKISSKEIAEIIKSFELDNISNKVEEPRELKRLEEPRDFVLIDSIEEQKEEPRDFVLIDSVDKVPTDTKENKELMVVESKPVKEENNDVNVNNKKGLFSGLLAIPFVKKIADRRNKYKALSNKEKTKLRKQMGIATAAVALAAVTLAAAIGGAFAGLGKKKNNKNDIVEEEIPSVCEPDDEITYLHSPKKGNRNHENNKQDIIDYYTNRHLEDNASNDDNEKHKSSLNIISNSGDITLGSVVTVKDNSYIYTNSYDAASETNYMTPLFDGSYKRDVKGVVYNLNGDIYTVYVDDTYANQNVQTLIRQGAKEEAVLLTRTDLDGYEGYYNVNSINKINNVTIEKPMSRARVRRMNRF